MHIVYPAVLSALLFSIGIYGVLARRNTILVLMSVELMLNAVNLNLVAFDVWWRDRLHGGQVFTLFVIVIAAAEVGLGLAIVLSVYRTRRTVDLDKLRDLADPGRDTEPGRSTRPGLQGAESGEGVRSEAGAEVGAGTEARALPRRGGTASPALPGDPAVDAAVSGAARAERGGPSGPGAAGT